MVVAVEPPVPEQCTAGAVLTLEIELVVQLATRSFCARRSPVQLVVGQLVNCLCSHVSRGHDKILPQLPFPHQVPGLDIAPVDFIRGHASHLHVIRQRDNAAGLIRTREERDPLSQGCVGNIRVGSRETRRDRERVESPKRTAEGERVVSNTEARPDDVLVAQTIGEADARSKVLFAN